MRRAIIFAIVLSGAAAGCGGEDGDAVETSSNPADQRMGSGDDGQYFYNWWTDNDNTRLVTFTNNAGTGSYTSKWDFRYVNCDSYGTPCPRDFVGGKGWKSGSDASVSYYATWTNSYGGCLGLYGWMDNPRVEYYVCDSTGAVEGPHNSAAESELQYKGEIFVDGSFYKVYKNTRRGKPSIFSNGSSNPDFDQYISVRTYPRTSGTITFKTHLQEWARLGMPTGTMTGGNPDKYKLLATEGWTGKGDSQVMLNPSGLKITIRSLWPANVLNAPTNATASCSVGEALPSTRGVLEQTCVWAVTGSVTLYSNCGSTGKPTVYWTGCDETPAMGVCKVNVKSGSAVTYGCSVSPPAH